MTLAEAFAAFRAGRLCAGTLCQFALRDLRERLPPAGPSELEREIAGWFEEPCQSGAHP